MVYVYRPKPSKPSSGGSSGRAAAAADGVPSTAKPAGEYDSRNNRWLVIGNTGSYDGVTDQEDLPPIPVEWIIAPNSNSSVSRGQCPSVGATINSFIISDVVSAVIAVFVCCRPIVKKFTCGCWGKYPSKKRRCCHSLWYTWLLSFAFTFFGNLFASLLVVSTKGYQHLSPAIVFALYASRPRSSVLLVALLRLLITVRTSDHSKAVGNITPVGSQSTVNSAPGVAVTDDKNIGNSSENQIIETVSCVKPFDKEYVYADSYRSTIVAEMVLHIISAVFIGVTWHRFPNEIIKTYMKPKTIFMQVATGILALSAIFVVPIYWKSNRYIKHSWLWALAALLAFGTVCAAPWVYWHYFLKLPGSL